MFELILIPAKTEFGGKCECLLTILLSEEKFKQLCWEKDGQTEE